MRNLLFFAAVLGVLLHGHAQGQTNAFTTADIDGAQSHTGSLGRDFSVTSPVIVSRLGAFDDVEDGVQSGFQSDTITVQLYDRDAVGGPAVLRQAAFTGAAGTLEGGYRYLDITDLTLPVGNYSIVAYGYSATENNGNTGLGDSAPTTNGGGLITFGDSRWNSSTAFPTNGDTGFYLAGSFTFEAVPEPASLGMIGLAGVALLRRRR